MEKNVLIGVTSQNLRTITGHAGRARKFIIYQQDGEDVREFDRLSLPKEMSMHEFRGGAHPLDVLDVLITGGCGQGFVRRMAANNIEVVATAESDPLIAVKKYIANEPLAPASAHDHKH